MCFNGSPIHKLEIMILNSTKSYVFTKVHCRTTIQQDPFISPLSTNKSLVHHYPAIPLSYQPIVKISLTN